MAKSNNQTSAGEGSVDQFVDSLTDKQQAEDSRKLLDIFNSVTGKPPVMWGTAMIGYGKLNITYTSGREVEWFNIGFSPRKGKLTLYVTFEADKLTSQYPKLGKYEIGKGCIYIKRLSDVDLHELEKLVKKAYELGWQSPERSDDREQFVKVEPKE